MESLLIREGGKRRGATSKGDGREGTERRGREFSPKVEGE